MDNSVQVVSKIEAHAVNPDAWDEFVEYRKAKRKPVSDLARKKLWLKLQRHTAEVQQEMVDRSIENDWQGLFEPPEPRRGSIAKAGSPKGGAGSTRARSIEEDLLDRSWAD